MLNYTQFSSYTDMSYIFLIISSIFRTEKNLSVKVISIQNSTRHYNLDSCCDIKKLRRDTQVKKNKAI